MIAKVPYSAVLLLKKSVLVVNIELRTGETFIGL